MLPRFFTPVRPQFYWLLVYKEPNAMLTASEPPALSQKLFSHTSLLMTLRANLLNNFIDENSLKAFFDHFTRYIKLYMA